MTWSKNYYSKTYSIQKMKLHAHTPYNYAFMDSSFVMHGMHQTKCLKFPPKCNSHNLVDKDDSQYIWTLLQIDVHTMRYIFKTFK